MMDAGARAEPGQPGLTWLREWNHPHRRPGAAWAWIALGLVLRTPTAVMNLGFVLLFPMTFLSNVFVAPATMPDWLRNVADANPISHLVTAARALMDGTAAGHDVLVVLCLC